MKEVSVREMREELARVLKLVEQGEDVSILRRGRPVARLTRPTMEAPKFRSRAELRDSLPPMREGAASVVRKLRDAERF
ncbi:type II toxin-antitoxin system prevent-host-death family antitoxin [Algiphilus sp. NNCM1]|uniref:type II toxin-antitoxin system Phd/YefM family antitoxin n=1 Tax=Algiphilus sp. TaxID=1872431 RepID=UPI001CA69AC8|nr:type II toxin-antitoxin system prevent-host-death family antitoxin [Algiphilus sp.]MBY8965025.1 type II toxin-antitoxin system prevent-host-death family antitoxin [Algiphilus acroporae]MCI5104181.1 type II toxin-antitoxin system prevent-host-death family antitoxin [Algiphilus sp.]